MTPDLPLADETDGPPAPPPEGPGLFGEAAPPAAPYRVLARKYRPRGFDDLIGQDALVRTLRNAFARGRVAHAFMLTGVRGVGKTTTARIIARALNCVGPDGTGGPTADPCGTCPECRAILADRHPDVLELDAASNNGVESVREIREAARFRPAQGRFKVYVLDEVHMLSGPAFNALLKTLEEPPPAVKFVFATTEIRKVPATILSRCQRFDLRRVPQETLRAHFARVAEAEGARVSPEALAALARAADGSVRDGLSLLDQALSLPEPGEEVSAEAVRAMLGLADRGLVLDLLEAVLRGDLPATLSAMDRAHEAGADPGAVLSDLAELVHTVTRLRAVPALRDDPALSEAERRRGGALAERVGVPVLGRAWQVLLKGLGEVAASPDRRAAAEMVLIRLAHLAELPTPGEALRRLREEREGAHAAASPSGPPAAGVPARAAPTADPGASPAVAPPATSGATALARAVASDPVPAAPASRPAEAPEAAPRPRSFREVVALAAGRRPRLHAELRLHAHPVRFLAGPEGGTVEFRPAAGAPRDLAAQLSAFLGEAAGGRWTVVLAREGGEPTLAEQGREAEAARRGAALDHPLVRAVLEAFPGAEIRAVLDDSLDGFGLSAPGSLPEDPDDPGFAPPEAEPLEGEP